MVATENVTGTLTTRALGASILATGVVLLRGLVARSGVVVGVISRDVRVCLSTSLEVLGRHIAVDETRVGATTVVRCRLGLDVVPIGTDVFKARGDLEERVGGRVSISGRIIRDFTGWGARLALR